MVLLPMFLLLLVALVAKQKQLQEVPGVLIVAAMDTGSCSSSGDGVGGCDFVLIVVLSIRSPSSQGIIGSDLVARWTPLQDHRDAIRKINRKSSVAH